jgi:KDO2-lipid IV(A) lauroyltransferase
MSFLDKAVKGVWVEIKYGVYRGTSWAASKLPLRVDYALASLVGDFIYLTWKRHSANAVSNMRRVLGPDVPWQVVKRTARQSFHNYAKTLVDFLRFPYLDKQDIQKAVVVREGLQYLRDAPKGNGVLVISGHIGNWDMAAGVMVGYGIALHAVSETHEPAKMDDLVNGTRERAGVKIIRLETGSLKQMFGALKRNEAVTILFDKPEPETGVPVQFFGETAYVPAGPGAIALKTGASVIVGYCVRRKDDTTFMGVVEPPIEYQSLLTGDKERDIQIITQEIVNCMERVIRRYPNQWYMFREMWPRTEAHDAEVRQKRFWGGKGHIEMVNG